MAGRALLRRHVVQPALKFSLWLPRGFVVAVGVALPLEQPLIDLPQEWLLHLPMVALLKKTIMARPLTITWLRLVACGLRPSSY